ncbi:MAG: hypothetical protein HY961_02615 [Ignavibacteriae bacterium]|nr:hypothetical protein [Ignavibacteriota bacterium]
MPSTTILFGVALIIIGLVGFFGTGQSSPTALIPAAFGFLLVALGMIARNEKLRKHAMHAAAVVGLLGFLGSASGLWQMLKMMMGEDIERPEAAIARSVMAIVCLIFVGLTVRSFVAARLTKKNA